MRQWVQISSGRGPAECAWTVARVLRCMLEEAAGLGVCAEVLESTPGPFSGTLSSVLVAFEGERVCELLTRWEGTIQWIGPSPFRPEHKRKNWFVGVKAVRVPERPAWSANELKFETMRASGPGGQHVNKVESAVRVTHLPTGLAVTAREERSQSANRRLALARLSWQLEERGKESERGVRRQRWSQHTSLERGNPVRTFQGPQFEAR